MCAGTVTEVSEDLDQIFR